MLQARQHEAGAEKALHFPGVRNGCNEEVVDVAWIIEFIRSWDYPKALCLVDGPKQ
jgi:hypothetical protein